MTTQTVGIKLERNETTPEKTRLFLSVKHQGQAGWELKGVLCFEQKQWQISLSESAETLRLSAPFGSVLASYEVPTHHLPSVCQDLSRIPWEVYALQASQTELSSWQTLSYQVAFGGAWAEGVELIPGMLRLRGVLIGVSNREPEALERWMQTVAVRPLPAPKALLAPALPASNALPAPNALPASEFEKKTSLAPEAQRLDSVV